MDVDALERRCPRLGGPVSFGYCRRSEAGGEPCFKVFDCWWDRFDVVSVMEIQVGAEGVERLRHARPRPKVSHILDLIAQAKQRTGQG